MDTAIIEALKSLPDIAETEGEATGNTKAVYLFTPDANATWVLWEYDHQTRLAFGMADLRMGFPELGYVNIDELDTVRGKLGLPIEMDSRITTIAAGYLNASVRLPESMEG